MSAIDTTSPNTDSSASSAAPVPKRITNAQTVCNERNEKGKLCNGHLKQLRTAGEPAEVHLRGDDVLFKCQTCGTFYMGPPLGHVRDPQKQSRFVEAELSALLQAAGGTLPVVKKDERGVFIMLETAAEPGHAAKPAAPKPAQPKPAPAKPVAPPTEAAAKTAPPPPTPKEETAPVPNAPKPVEQKAGAEPNRQLFKRSTYAGVTDTGPLPGETFEQKVARLKALAAGAKQRAEEAGSTTATSVAALASETPPVVPEAIAPPIEPVKEQAAPPVSASLPAPPATSSASPASSQASTHQPTGKADRTLMKRSTYCGVVDTGPVPGETFEQKVARLTALAAAAKQRADGG